MSLLIGFLTFILVMNCLFLMLLILIQLPKKEAGAGIAFGGAATDALFGAGSGNALTKLTKYAAGVFVGLAVLLSVMETHYAHQGSRRIEQELSKQVNSTAVVPPAAPVTSNSLQVAPATTNLSLSSTNLMLSAPTNVSATPAPNAEQPAAAAPAPAQK